MNLSTNAKVGIITLLALIMLGAVVTWKSEIFLIRGGYRLIGTFQNIEGLTIGSEVRYRGFNVGKVIYIDPTPKNILVYSMVKRSIRIPADSTLRIAFDGLVGLKYLEIRPGTSEAIYKEGQILEGKTTAGIVDFIDIGSQNLQETRQIVATFKKFVQDPKLQSALTDAILTAREITYDIRELTAELRATNQGIREITTDPEFQASVKGTVSETHRTLKSANNFFSSFSRINLKPSGEVLIGSNNNVVRGNIDLTQNPGDYIRFGVGEGPTRDLGLHDILLARKINQKFGLKLGMINSQLGGGLDFYSSPAWILSGDVYDINNPKPNVPKFRLTSAHGLSNFFDIILQADDIFNPERNYLIGASVKGSN